ncbi:unnamed protein product [Durusdinium trenchii]|uniref:Uncharacterized protein n=1 Tax=Durusdinium trenchii TaxID=1381693 RepID=A0ABP0QDI0_9DINO
MPRYGEDSRPKAAEELDMKPEALAHLHKLHSRLGSEVWTEESRKTQSYRVDNGFLKAQSVGLGFRRSKDMKDLVPDTVVPWGSRIQGVDEGDGWLRLGANYLPFFVHGIPVISPDGSRQLSPWSSPRSVSEKGQGSMQSLAGAKVAEAGAPWPRSPGMLGGAGTISRTPGPSPIEANVVPLSPPMPTAPFDFASLRELVRLLRECHKKVSKGLRPNEELQMLEQIRRSLANDLAMHQRSGVWHYLLQEILLTQDAIEGKYPSSEAKQPPGTKVPSSPWQEWEEFKKTALPDSDEDEPPRRRADETTPSLVGPILTEALSGSGAAALLDAVPAALRTHHRHQPQEVEDRCVELERHVARVRQARHARQR